MRPLTLTVEGLTAFRHEQTIDFSDLRLFVITGPTGSGKTSILDAITFALYGNVVRVKAGELKDLITHNQPSMKVQLEFEVSGDRYRVVRRVRRKGQPEAILEKITAEGELLDVELPGVRQVNARIEALLGLDFDAFTKAVLLPQGKFHEFLSGDASARRKILTGLLELERYNTMGMIARQRAKDLSLTLEERERRLAEDFADATEERLAATQQELKAATARQGQLADAVERARERLLLAEEQRQVVARLDEGLRPLRDMLPELAGLRDEESAADRNEAALAAELESAVTALSASEAARSSADQAVRDAVEKHGDEARLTNLSHAAATLVTETANLGRVLEQLEEAGAGVAKASGEVAGAKERALKADQAVDESTAAGQRLSAAHEVAKTVLRVAELSDRLKAAGSAATAANEKLKTAADGREQAEAALEHLRDQHVAASLQNHLTAGEPCPVCLQIVGEVPATEPGLEELLADARSRCDRAAEEMGQAQEVAADTRARVAALKRDIEEARKSLPEGVAELKLEPARAAVSTAEAALKAARDGHRARVEEQRGCQEALRDAMAAESRWTQRVASLTETRDDLTGRIDRVRAALDDEFGKRLPEDVGELVGSRLEALKKLRQELDAATSACEGVRTQVELARRRHQDLMNGRERVRSGLTRSRAVALAAVEATARQVPGFDQDMLPSPSEEGGVTEQIEALAELCRRALGAGGAAGQVAAGRVESVRLDLLELAQTAGIAAEGEGPDGIVGLLAEANRQAERRHDLLEHQLTEMDKKIARRKVLEASTLDDRRQRNLYLRLGHELQADRFMAFVLGESMRTLAALATVELLKITGTRYSIEPQESGFAVVDHDNGDERRSVATLSGGETFLASLALALALSGSIRDLAGNAAAARLDSMFIDEGFGALDADTLDVAVEALEQLVEADRMVGVISHVPALSDRISSGLAVHKVGVSSTVARR